MDSPASPGYVAAGQNRRHTVDPFASALEDFAFWGLIALVALAPLPFGSSRPWAWSVAGLILAVLLFLTIAAQLIDRSGNRVSSRSPWSPALWVGGGVIIWAFFQASNLAPVSWQHPLWQQMPSLLGRAIAGYISIDPTASLVSVFRMLEYAALFVLATRLCRTRERANIAVQSVILAGILYSIYGLIEFSAGNRHILWFEKWAYLGDLTSTFVNHNSFATYAGIAFVCGVGLTMDEVRRRVDPRTGVKARIRAILRLVLVSRWWLFAGLLAIAAALLLSHSRGGFLATCVGLGVLGTALAVAPGFAVPWRARGTIAAVLAAGLALAVYGQATLDRLVEGTGRPELRPQIYESAARAIADFRWTGTGLGTFRFVFPPYGQSDFDEALEFAHNDYLENALELGIPAALALYLAIAWVIGICIFGALRRRHRVLFPCLGLSVASLAATHELFDFSLQIPAVTFAAVLVVGVAATQSQERTSAP